MTKASFTPGPWEVVPLSGYGGPYAIRMAMPAGAKHPTHYGVQVVGTESDAHLIAAAPDMYEALKAAKVVIGMMERPEGMGEEVNAALDKRLSQIDAALSKAEGRS